MPLNPPVTAAIAGLRRDVEAGLDRTVARERLRGIAGTHFVQEVEYAKAVSIVASSNDFTQQSLTEFAAEVHGSGGGMGGAASFSSVLSRWSEQFDIFYTVKATGLNLGPLATLATGRSWNDVEDSVSKAIQQADAAQTTDAIGEPVIYHLQPIEFLVGLPPLPFVDQLGSLYLETMRLDNWLSTAGTIVAERRGRYQCLPSAAVDALAGALENVRKRRQELVQLGQIEFAGSRHGRIVLPRQIALPPIPEIRLTLAKESTQGQQDFYRGRVFYFEPETLAEVPVMYGFTTPAEGWVNPQRPDRGARIVDDQPNGCYYEFTTNVAAGATNVVFEVRDRLGRRVAFVPLANALAG